MCRKHIPIRTSYFMLVQMLHFENCSTPQFVFGTRTQQDTRVDGRIHNQRNSLNVSSDFLSESTASMGFEIFA